jgi:DNA polymerase-3 subunit epsilon
MLNKIYIDLETTGLDPVKNGIIQIAGVIDTPSNGTIEFEYCVRPFLKDEITDEALQVTGKTREEILGYEEPYSVYKKFISKLLTHIDRYNSKQKFIFIGYNSRFDADFLRAWLIKNSDQYFGSYFFWPPVDVMNLAAHSLSFERATLPDFKLGTVARHLGIEVPHGEALHDAMTDINLTIQIENKLQQRLREATNVISN